MAFEAEGEDWDYLAAAAAAAGGGAMDSPSSRFDLKIRTQRKREIDHGQ